MATKIASFQNIRRAVSAYANRAFTDARAIASTSIFTTGVRVNPGGLGAISGSSEDYYGTVRWDNPMGTLNYAKAKDTGETANTNIATGDESDNEGVTSDFTTDTAEYIKAFRTAGANQYNVTEVIARRSGSIAKMGATMGRTRAQDADAIFSAIAKGVINAEIARAGSVAKAKKAAEGGYGQTDAKKFDEGGGFFVDLNASAGANSTAGTKKLVDTSQVDKAGGGMGAAVRPIFESVAKAWSDQREAFYYLVVDPETYLDIQQLGLFERSIQDGNLNVQTILNGAFRVIESRGVSYSVNGTATTGVLSTNFAGGLTSAVTQAVNSGSTRLSLVCRPGAIAYVPIPVVDPVAFDRDESLGRGAGRREAWYRWAYIAHPMGYTWDGAKTAFVEMDTYEAAASWARAGVDDNTTAANLVAGAGVGPESLGILPIFHA